MHHDIHGLTLRKIDELDRSLRHARMISGLRQKRTDCRIGSDRLRTAAQDHGISRLQAKRRRIRSHVGTRFINDADDPQRHSHTADFQAIRAHRGIIAPQDRIRKGGRLPKPLRHLGNAPFIQHETIQIGAAQALLPRILQVLRIFCQHKLRALFQRIRHGQKRLILRIRRQDAHGTRCRLSRLGFVQDLRFDIHFFAPT